MGFFEILVIVVITLLILGPEKMPEALRSGALLIGRLKRSMRSASDTVQQQLGIDDLKKQLDQEAMTAQLSTVNEGISELDKKISSGEQDMPWTAEEYEQLKENANK